MPLRHERLVLCRAGLRWIGVFATLASAAVSLAEDAKPPMSGPGTEARFPPLALADGFQATLFACDPLVEYPSVIALGPRLGALYVAHDYVTGLGVEIVRRDEVRLLEDTDGDGYADRSTLVAGEFNSIQGLAWHDGTLYVMHAPLLTSLRDADGDGTFEARRDLLDGLGLPPEKNSSRLHCANGVVVGHDGWLYLAMGDNGTDVVRPEGDRLLLQAGGILRCRPDGRDLHVFSTGLRNIYDVALDEELNVFVRDNENDGGTYMIRVCRSFHGADHGYPYNYYERPDEGLAPLADLGRGSSAGVVCYLETAFPPAFRGNLFCCEWGRSVVRYERIRSGGHFAPMREIEFAAAAENDPYGLKPTDVIVDRDGSLVVSDWGDGQRPKRGRGRIYRIAPKGRPNPPTPGRSEGLAGWIDRLDEPGALARIEAQDEIQKTGDAGLAAVRAALREKRIGIAGRLHAVWILARLAGPGAIEELFALAKGDGDPRVRASAVRAIADLADPILAHRRLDAGRGDPAIAGRLAALGVHADPRVLLEVVVALGRLKWPESPAWLSALDDPAAWSDPAFSHAALQTLRRCDNWPAVLALVDGPLASPIRAVALRAAAGQFAAPLVAGLLERLDRDGDTRRGSDYAELLTRVHRRPGPWVYWGYRPGPRPANTEPWDQTAAIEASLDRALGRLEPDGRAELLRRMLREEVPARSVSLVAWLQTERVADRVAVILDALAKAPPAEAREPLAAVVAGRDYVAENRRAALGRFLAGLADDGAIVELAARVEDGPVLVPLLDEIRRRPALEARPLVLAKLESPDAGVRAAAIRVAAARRLAEASPHVARLLGDRDANVRREAADAVGTLSLRDAADALLSLTRDDDPATRSASFSSLRRLGDRRGLDAAVSALDQTATQIAALDYLAELGGAEHAGAAKGVAERSRSVESLTAVVRALAAWDARDTTPSESRRELLAALAEVHGTSGVFLHWRAVGPLSEIDAAETAKRPDAAGAAPAPSKPLIASGPESRVEWSPADVDASRPAWLAVAEASLSEPGRVQLFASSGGGLVVWLNGRLVHQREKPGAFQTDSDRFEAELVRGTNRVVVRADGTNGPAPFHLRFRRLSASAEHERLTQYALQNAGNAERGRELFFNREKSLCLKCHRLDAEGETIGPNLTGVGSRFSRIHLIESILDPSRTIAPSYETLAVSLQSGRVVTGVKIAEDAATLSLGDETGKRHDVPKAEIDDRAAQRNSTMPAGLEKRFTDRELLDLLAFLQAQKKGP